MGILVGDFGFFHNFDPEILDFFQEKYTSLGGGACKACDWVTPWVMDKGTDKPATQD